MKDQSIDAYKPAEIAEYVKALGVTKALLPIVPTIMLGLMAGAFISFGAMFYTLVMTNHEMGLGPARLLGGLTFSLGMILVVVAGAELFTGNNFIVMAWVEKKVTTIQLLRNWGIVYLANFVGTGGAAVLVYLSGTLAIGDSAVANTALSIAEYKTEISTLQAFVRGILCNALVCLAVWLCFAARDVASKILAIVFPVAAFVALGFEHCIANMYFILIGILISDGGIGASEIINNLVPVTLGNIVGGSLFVAFVYWIVYLRGQG